MSDGPERASLVVVIAAEFENPATLVRVRREALHLSFAQRRYAGSTWLVAGRGGGAVEDQDASIILSAGGLHADVSITPRAKHAPCDASDGKLIINDDAIILCYTAFLPRIAKLCKPSRCLLLRRGQHAAAAGVSVRVMHTFFLARPFERTAPTRRRALAHLSGTLRPKQHIS